MSKKTKSVLAAQINEDDLVYEPVDPTSLDEILTDSICRWVISNPDFLECGFFERSSMTYFDIRIHSPERVEVASWQVGIE